jgi:hypothetical protein
MSPTFVKEFPDDGDRNLLQNVDMCTVLHGVIFQKTGIFITLAL